MGMLAAVEYWSRADLGALNREWQKPGRTHPEAGANGSRSHDRHRLYPEEGNSYPTLTVTWDEAKFGLTIAQCDKQLRDGRTPD